MFGLRQALAISCLLLFGLSVGAAEQTLGLSYGFEEAASSGISMKPEGLRPIRNQKQSLDYSLDSSSGWDLGIQVLQFQHDYSSTYYRDAAGVESTFADMGRNETQTGGSLGYRFGEFRLAGSHIQTSTSASLFKTRRSQVGLEWKSDILGLSMEAKAVLQEVDQPETYFLDSNFRLQSRPRVAKAQQAALAAEQILSSRAKARLGLTQLWRPQERPRSYEVRLQGAYAWTGRLFSQLEVHQAWDERQDPVKDDRGYFEVRGAMLSISYEPLYELLVTGSYGYTMEFEELPLSKVEAGTAQYGMGASYSHFPWELGVQVASMQSQVRGNGLSAQGDMKWAF